MIGFRLDKTVDFSNARDSKKRQPANVAPQADNRLAGNPVWDFIADKKLRNIYEIVFSTATNSKNEIVIRHHRDSPSLSRFMESRVFAWTDDTFFVYDSLNTEDRTEQTASQDHTVQNPYKYQSVCSWCKKVKVGDEWVEVQNPFRELDLFSSETPVQLTHGICPTCFVTVLAEDETPD